MTEPDERPEEWSEEDPLVRALRAPGTPAELAREQEYVAAFRAAAPRRRLRLVRRAGVAGGAVAVTIGLSAGVAAAYSNALPEPVQRLAHSVLGPVGVPAAAPRTEDARARRPPAAPASSSSPHGTATPAPRTTPPVAPGPTSTPSRTPGARPTSPAPTVAAGTTLAPGAGGTPTPPTATPAATPSRPPKPAAARPRHLALAVSGRRVGPRGVVTVSGWLTARSGAGVAGRTVRLRARVAGGGWRVVASGTTGANGTVVLRSAPLDATTTLRLASGRLRSHPVEVVLVPRLRASYAGGAVRATVGGGRAGDRVVVLRGGSQVASGRLDADGSVSFPVEPRRKPVRLVVRLARTGQHAEATDRVTVPAAR